MFKCPKCGSFMYGSSKNPDGSWTRHCHSNENGTCDFSWHEKDDWMYFKENDEKYVLGLLENDYYEMLKEMNKSDLGCIDLERVKNGIEKLKNMLSPPIVAQEVTAKKIIIPEFIEQKPYLFTVEHKLYSDNKLTTLITSIMFKEKKIVVEYLDDNNHCVENAFNALPVKLNYLDKTGKVVESVTIYGGNITKLPYSVSHLDVDNPFAHKKIIIRQWNIRID